jgi:glyoxylase-like metal-dependent hydrolase (beta-lactamase superfamily II)
VEELRPGLWYWTAIHPTWYDNEVGSYAWDAGSTLVLIDPLSPPTLVDELASGKELTTILTCDWHDRSAPELVERLGSRIHAPAGGDGGLDAELFEPGQDGLPAGIEAFGATHPGEVALWIGERNALVMGDALITKDGTLIVPPTWLPENDTVAEAQRRMAPLLELPVELVLTTHGEPVRENAAEALRKALLQSSS